MYPYFGKTQFLRGVIQLPFYLAKEIYDSGGARSHNKVTFRIASLQGGHLRPRRVLGSLIHQHLRYCCPEALHPHSLSPPSLLCVCGGPLYDNGRILLLAVTQG